MGSRREETGGVEKNQFAVMVVAALVATMAVRALAWPPGGYWTQDGPSADHIEYVAGSPKMAYLSPRAYLFLVVSSTVAYVGAMTIALVLLVRELYSLVHEAFVWSQMVTVVSMVMMWVVFCLMSMVFTILLGAVAPSQYGTTSYVLVSLVQVWTCLAWILPPGHFIWRKIMRNWNYSNLFCLSKDVRTGSLEGKSSLWMGPLDILDITEPWLLSEHPCLKSTLSSALRVLGTTDERSPAVGCQIADLL